MILYQPTPREISATLAAAHIRFPMLGTRLDNAGELLADVNRYFDLDAGPWRIQSQTGPDSYEVACPGGASRCTCPDHAYRAAAAPDYFCKHIIAYHAYRRILAAELNRRLVGDYNFRSERNRAQLFPGSLILLRDKTIRAVTYPAGYRVPRGVCALRRSKDDSLIPANDLESALLAEWLATAPDFEPSKPYSQTEYEADRAAYIDMQAERQPLMTMIEYRHWIATGETPAMVRNT